MSIHKSTTENLITAILLVLAVLVLCAGCSVKQADIEKPGTITTETKPDGTVIVTETSGTKVTVTINSLLTSERSDGLSYGRVDGEVMLELGPMGTDPKTELLQDIVDKIPE